MINLLITSTSEILSVFAFVVCFFLIGFFSSIMILKEIKIERIFPKGANTFYMKLLYFLLSSLVGMVFSIFIILVINILR